ncbi:MAG: tetratricopeptide repeat protein [Myxococcota bacterium]
MDRFLRELPGEERRHAVTSAPTVEEPPVGLEERGPEEREWDTVDRRIVRLFRGSNEQTSSDASAASCVRGLTFGRYVVLGELGSGGMGMVLKAYDESLERPVAIKLLHVEIAQRHTDRLRREAQALAKLSHPNVVQVYEVGQHDGQWFIAMELVGGQTLRDWQQTPRRWRESVGVYLHAGAGLAAAHAVGLVHRDFKPDNCILDRAGRPRVLDFGLVGGDVVPSLDVTATEIEAIGIGGGAIESSLTEPGTVLGTPAYMPLEQMRGEGTDARGDQFSFCVSLYEAVYGERPFEGDTMTALQEAVSSGAVRPASKGAGVPGSLRQILLRGLAADPMKRWPSMEQLLAELQRLVVPRRGRWLALSAGLALGLGLIGVGLAADVRQRCTGAREQMDGIWDEVRRHEVEAAILGAEVFYAPDTWERVEQRLDAYADAWVGKHTEVCEATSVRGEQSEDAMRLRMRCLGKRRTSLRASVDVLSTGNAEVAKNAINLVTDLPLLTRCDDLDWLEQQDQRIAPPEDPDMAAEVETLRERLADIVAMERAGRYPEALAKVEVVVQQAEILRYPPLLAEAQYWQGALRDRNGQYAEAEQDLKQAHTLAVEHQHDEIALDTAQALTGVVGSRLARHVEARQWGQMVALPLALRCGEPVELAMSLNNLGLVYWSQGQFDEAKEYHERALTIWEQALGIDHPHVAMGLNNLGSVYWSRGEYGDAEVCYERALAIKEKLLGAEHPNMAYGLSNLGAVHASQGEYEEAEHHHERALKILEKVLGTEHPHVASSLNNLGTVYFGQGRYEEAQWCHERALRIQEQALGTEHPHVAISLSNLGNVYLGRRTHEEAKEHYERALRIREKVLGVDHPRVAYSLVGLAIAVLEMNDPESARAHAERAVSICEEAGVAPEVTAKARFVLAQSLWNNERERARSRALAEQARDALDATKGAGESSVDLADVEVWLATHHVG